jgi:hypothetical protein
MKRFVMAVVALAVPLIAAASVTAQDDGWGTIKGRVVWGPKDIPLQMPIAAVNQNGDKAHCLKDGAVLDENWVVDKKSRGLRWTLVWLINDDVKNKKPLPIHPNLQNIVEPKVVVDQPVCAFIPHALAMREGQILVAKNSSPVAHNIKWNGSKNPGGNVIVPAGKEHAIKNLVAEKLPMRIECNLHSWMKGYVGIFNHPYFAVTDADGNFEIKDAPAGKYRVVVWNSAYHNGVGGNKTGIEVAIPAGKTADLGTIQFMPPKE